MVKNCRRSNPNRKLCAIVVVCIFLIISGCASKGGARVHVAPSCEGLESLGYSAPFSVQDANDIEALGYSECASLIRERKA